MAGYILVSDSVVQRLPPTMLSVLVMVGAAVTLAVRAAVTGGVDFGFGVDGWFWLVCIAAVSTVVAMLTFFAGLRRTGPSTGAILSTFETRRYHGAGRRHAPGVPRPGTVGGGLLVLSAVAVVQIRPPRADVTAGDPHPVLGEPAVESPDRAARASTGPTSPGMT